MAIARVCTYSVWHDEVHTLAKAFISDWSAAFLSQRRKLHYYYSLGDRLLSIRGRLFLQLTAMTPIQSMYMSKILWEPNWKAVSLQVCMSHSYNTRFMEYSWRWWQRLTVMQPSQHNFQLNYTFLHLLKMILIKIFTHGGITKTFFISFLFLLWSPIDIWEGD